MAQLSFGDAEYAGKKKRIKREIDLPGRDGAGRSVECTAERDRTVLPGSRTWTPALSPGEHAAHPPDAELARAERSGNGRSPL